MIYKMNHTSILNCGYEIKCSHDPCSYERNFSNCVEKPEKFRTSTRFEPMILWCWCDALTNRAVKPLMFGAGYLWVPMMNENYIWNESCIEMRKYEIKWSYSRILTVVSSLYTKEVYLVHDHVLSDALKYCITMIFTTWKLGRIKHLTSFLVGLKVMPCQSYKTETEK